MPLYQDSMDSNDFEWKTGQANNSLEDSDAKLEERFRNRRNVKKGKSGENLVKNKLEQLGLHMVEKVEVGWGIKRDRRGRPVEVWPLAKVSGDFRAMTSKGQSVLVEVKTYDDERFILSALEAHQITALDTHCNLGGLSLLVWVRYGEVIPMWWPVNGLEKGKGISYEQALDNKWKGEV